jgi:hypothetical protein
MSLMRACVNNCRRMIQSIELNTKVHSYCDSFCRTDGRESPILTESDADHNSDKPRVKYGELVILG